MDLQTNAYRAKPICDGPIADSPESSNSSLSNKSDCYFNGNVKCMELDLSMRQSAKRDADVDIPINIKKEVSQAAAYDDLWLPGALERFKMQLKDNGTAVEAQSLSQSLSPDATSKDSVTSPSDSGQTAHGSSDYENISSPDQIQVVESTTKLKLPKDKTCTVCGDKALGYNFNAVSCESCKAFFRRNAHKEIRGRCEGTCDVTVESRSYCKKCRLKKCFTVGMKKDLILNDRQKYTRRQKIHENRLRRQGLPVTPLLEPPPNLSTAHTSPTSLVKVEPENKTHQIASEVDPHNLDGLKERTREKIQEVLDAFKLSFDCPVENQPQQSPSGEGFLNMADSSVRRLVKMAKQLSSFRSLDQEDQIGLLKGAVVEVLILRSAKLFDSSNHGWQVNKGGAQTTVSAQSFNQGNNESLKFFQQYKQFVTSLLQYTLCDDVVLMLMIVLTVFSPDRVKLNLKSEVSDLQEDYALILKEYTLHRYPTYPNMFAKAMQKLTDIRDINETHTRMLMHMQVDKLEPLIVEIFDLSAS